MDFVIEVLVEYGFERTDFVYEPGQFSIRGGIVDLFSWGNELPYRIELFDDEVESIRTFDPLTQLSNQNIRSVSIIPNLNTRFRQDQKVSLLRVLPPTTVIWVKDFQFVLDRLQFCFEKAETFAGKLSALDTAELREIFRDRAFLYPREVVEEVRARGMVFLEKGNLKLEMVQPAHSGKPFPISNFQFLTKPQPSFNKNFDLLIRALHEWQAAGYEVFIFSENAKQIDRLSAIFRELKAKVNWHPVEAALSEGFLDDDLKIACLTDHRSSSATTRTSSARDSPKNMP